MLDFLTEPIQLGNTQFPFSILTIFLEFIFPAIGVFIVYKFSLLGIKKVFSSLSIKTATKENILKWLRRAFRFVYILVIVLLAGRLFGAKIFEYLNTFYSFLKNPFFESGGTKISIITLILAIPVFYFASWTAKTVRRLLESMLLTRLNIDSSRKFSIANLVRYVVMVIVILFGLSIIGINLSSLAVLFGVLGIGLGFGLQGVVANFFAGLVIILTRPVKEGDRIFVNNVDGVVVHIRTLTTVINTLTNETIIVPNAQITDNYVHNYSYDERSIYIVNSVQVAYGSNLDRVVELLKEIGQRNPYAIQDKDPKVFVRSFDDSGITCNIWTWIKDVEYKLLSHSWTNLAIWRSFERNGIVIPFPQRDVHIKSTPPHKEESHTDKQ